MTEAANHQHQEDVIIKPETLVNGVRTDSSGLVQQERKRTFFGFPPATIHTGVTVFSVIGETVATALPETPNGQLAAGIVYTLSSFGLIYQGVRQGVRFKRFINEVKAFRNTQKSK